MDSLKIEIKQLMNIALEQGDTPRSYLKRVAERVRMTYWKLIKMINPTEDTPVDMSDFICLYRETGDKLRPALSCVVEKCVPRLVIGDVIPATVNGTFADEKDDLAVAAGKIVEELRLALRDNRIDEPERRRVVDRAIELKGIADRFICEINALAKRSQ